MCGIIAASAMTEIQDEVVAALARVHTGAMTVLVLHGFQSRVALPQRAVLMLMRCMKLGYP
jgi:hypothetical protein